MAKAPVVSAPSAFKLPELKLPKVDVVALFAARKANLATVHEAQTVLLGAAEAIAKVQYGYVEGAFAEAKAKAAAQNKELPKAKTIKATGDKVTSVAKEVVDLAVAAQKRVAELLTQRTQAAVTELKSMAA